MATHDGAAAAADADGGAPAGAPPPPTAAAAAAGLPPTAGGTVAVPCLLIDDMPAALAFYADALHLHPAWASDAAGTPVPVGDRGRRRDVTFVMLKAAAGAELLLQSRPQLASADYLPAGAVAAAPPPPGSGSPLTLYLRGVDVDAAAAALPPSVEVLVPPRTMPYGMRELALRDPAGHVVVLTRSVGDQ